MWGFVSVKSIFCFFKNVFNRPPRQGRENQDLFGTGLTHDKILGQTKFKAFADDKLNVRKMISVFDRVENIVGKGEIACTSNFSFPTMFLKGFFPRCVKRCHCVGMG